MANNQRILTDQDLQSFSNRANIVEQRTQSDTAVIRSSIMTMGDQILKLQKHSVDVHKLAREVTELSIPMIRASEEKSEQISQLLHEVIRAQTRAEIRVQDNQPVVEDFPVVCPHHRQRIILKVQKEVYTNPEGIPTWHYNCPLKLSTSCHNRTLRHDWKTHIKSKCLPYMVCKNSNNNPEEGCGPEQGAL